MSVVDDPLRVSLIAGSLGIGGAEKQLVYQTRVLKEAGVDVRIYCLTQKEYFESALLSIGVRPIWVGRYKNPILRIISMIAAMRPHKPHIVHSTHFFTNIYAAIVARVYQSVSIGSIRNDTAESLRRNRIWGRWLVRSPSALVANSNAARRSARPYVRDPEKVFMIPNVVDLSEFDRRVAPPDAQFTARNGPTAVAVARLVKAKRLDRFLSALAMARKQCPDLMGVIVGEGPERAPLENLAQTLGLLPEGIKFLGRRTDVPAIISHCEMFVLTSEYEGFPNVILEAMAAGLPVVTTPAGEASSIVDHGYTGFVVPPDNPEYLADRLIKLARSPDLRSQMGEEGRRRVEQLYKVENLLSYILEIYASLSNFVENQDSHQLTL